MPRAIPLPPIAPKNDFTVYARLVKESDTRASETEYTNADGAPQAFISATNGDAAAPLNPALVVDGEYLPASKVWRFAWDRTVMSSAVLGAAFGNGETPYVIIDQPGNAWVHLTCVYVPAKAAQLVEMV